MADSYKPADYWSERLSDQYDLRGTGHLSYSRRYNDWLYRAKRRALRAALHGVRPGALALDIGSGTGWVVRELLAAGLRVEGCDIADIAVKRLNTAFPQAHFFQAAVGTDPLPRQDRSYEVITALDVTYHVTDDEAWMRSLREIARVLQPGGRFVVSDGFGDTDRIPDSHVRFRSASRWADATRAVGLREERLKPYFRWLSRDRDGGILSRLPDGFRGATEYLLETIAPREPHMRLAVYSRHDRSSSLR